jgi:segregation and condensation protein B
MSLPLPSQIEALLFWKAETLSIKKIANILEKSEAEVREAIKTLHEDLKGRGITLVEWEDDVTLGTAQGASELIEKLNKEELSKDLGKAGLETLSIILYQGPISRADIDYIRGVNSQFIVRNLLIRGLIDKVDNPADQRSFLYKPTLELLSFLGVSKIEDVPDFESVRKDIENFKINDAQTKN